MLVMIGFSIFGFTSCGSDDDSGQDIEEVGETGDEIEEEEGIEEECISVFNINLDPTDCSVSLDFESSYTEIENEETRTKNYCSK